MDDGHALRSGSALVGHAVLGAGEEAGFDSDLVSDFASDFDSVLDSDFVSDLVSDLESVFDSDPPLESPFDEREPWSFL
jgi:hypothetical protein